MKKNLIFIGIILILGGIYILLSKTVFKYPVLETEFQELGEVYFKNNYSKEDIKKNNSDVFAIEINLKSLEEAGYNIDNFKSSFCNLESTVQIIASTKDGEIIEHKNNLQCLFYRTKN